MMHLQKSADVIVDDLIFLDFKEGPHRIIEGLNQY